MEILYASIIFFIVWLITAFLKKKSSRWDYALWFLVLLRLMLPPNLSSPVSGRNLLFNSSVFESLFEYFIQTQYTNSVGFENMKNPFTKKIVHHNGIDIAAPNGTEVYAAAKGKVKSAVVDYEKNKGPGKHIVIQHTARFETFYSHLDDVLVKEGQEIKAGEIIGKVGTTGMSTGNHLHFEIRQNGEVQDPKNYIDFKELVRVNKD